MFYDDDITKLSLLDLEKLGVAKLDRYVKVYGISQSSFIDKQLIRKFLYFFRYGYCGHKIAFSNMVYSETTVHNEIIKFIFSFYEYENYTIDYLFNSPLIKQFIEKYFDEFKDYVLRYNNSKFTLKFIEVYYDKIDQKYLKACVYKNPNIVIKNEDLFRCIQTQRTGEPFVKIPDSDEKYYLEYKLYDYFGNELVHNIKNRLYRKHDNYFPQKDKQMTIHILLTYNKLVVSCLNLFEKEINYDEQDLFEIFKFKVFIEQNFIYLCDQLNLDEAQSLKLFNIYCLLRPNEKRKWDNLRDKSALMIGIKGLKSYQVVQKLKNYYYKSYEQSCKEVSEKTIPTFLRSILSDSNFIKLLNNNRLTPTDIEDILIVSKIFGDDFRKHLEDIVKYHREQSLANYNKIVRASFVSGEELDKILNELGLNKDNIYDYILNNKVLHKKEKEGLISIIKVHYKDYISVLDIMYLLDEMVERQMTIDEILKEKEISKKDFYDLYKKSLDDNPILYEYISGKLKENKKRGFKKFIKLAYYIINNINSYLEYQEKFKYNLNDILNSLEQSTVYDLFLEKMKSWPDYNLIGFQKAKK